MLTQKENEEMSIVIENMQKYGGGFVKALAECYIRADIENYHRLREAFPEYWETYLNFGKQYE